MQTVSLTLKSSNAKTGPIPVSTSTKNWCPNACALKGSGCYAESGPLAIHWSKITKGERGNTWDEFCEQIAALPDGQLWRHNQAGDLPGDGDALNMWDVAGLIQANEGKRGFTYTHYSPLGDSDASVINRAVIKDCNDNGFTVNLSAESLEHADALAALNIGPVATILPGDAPRKQKTPEGRDVITCPATYRDDVSCATCQLCARQRAAIIGFPVHGTGAKKAARVIALKRI